MYYIDNLPVTGFKYLTSDGNSNWYYFNSDGIMLSNKCENIDGEEYCFNNSGVCISGKACN